MSTFDPPLQLFLWDFNGTLNFRDRFSKNTQISNFMKIRPVAAELFHANGRTDMTKLIVAIRNYANASKKHSKFSFLSNLWNRLPSRDFSGRTAISCHSLEPILQVTVGTNFVLFVPYNDLGASAGVSESHLDITTTGYSIIIYRNRRKSMLIDNRNWLNYSPVPVVTVTWHLVTRLGNISPSDGSTCSFNKALYASDVKKILWFLWLSSLSDVALEYCEGPPYCVTWLVLCAKTSLYCDICVPLSFHSNKRRNNWRIFIAVGVVVMITDVISTLHFLNFLQSIILTWRLRELVV